MRQGETLVPKPTVFYSFRISGTRHITKTVKTTHRKHRKPPTVSPDRPLPEHRQTHFSPKPYSMKIKKASLSTPDKSPMVISMNRTEPPHVEPALFPPAPPRYKPTTTRACLLSLWFIDCSIHAAVTAICPTAIPASLQGTEAGK